MRKPHGLTGLLSCPRCEGDDIMENSYICPQQGLVGVVFCDDCKLGVMRAQWEGGIHCARRVWQSPVMELCDEHDDVI